MSVLAGIETDASIKQILAYRQKVTERLQCEITRVVTRMVKYRVEMIPEHDYKEMHQIGCNRQNQDDWNGAEELWEMLVRKEWKVLVFHDQRWRPGTCAGVANEKRGRYYAGYLMDLPFDPEEKLTYDIKLGDQLLEGVDRGLVIIRSEVILRLQDDLDEVRRDLKALVDLKQKEARMKK
jgi:hypothetical protein